jgi:hypothetical protein
VTKSVRFAALVGVAFLIVGSLALYFYSRTAGVRERLIATLEDKLDSDVELGDFSISTFPTLRISGSHLVLRHKHRTDVPPLITIDRFSVEGGLLGLLSRSHRVHTVRLDGLKINVPHGSDTDGPNNSASHQGGVIIDHIVSNNAELVLLPKEDGKEPKIFTIHSLELDEVGFDRPMQFRATLTNPTPEGQIQTQGRFGPWAAGEPSNTPVEGTYEFKNANLGTIKGIGGILTSDGKFGGTLKRIAVEGKTDTPDFQVDVGQPVHLRTTFRAVVDGTNGNTYLDPVNASFLNTKLAARGAVEGRHGVKGRAVVLDVVMTEGRIEDVLRLATKNAKPSLVGAMMLETHLDLPPGHVPVIDKLNLKGRFAIGDGRFTDRTVAAKLGEMSSKAQGQPDTSPSTVVTAMAGRYTLSNATLRFSDLRFEVPGATVQLNGEYALRREQLDFQGLLRMQATLSQAAGGGTKGFFLKAFDPIFKKHGAGAELPIVVTGTRTEPQFRLDKVRAFTWK